MASSRKRSNHWTTESADGTLRKTKSFRSTPCEVILEGRISLDCVSGDDRYAERTTTFTKTPRSEPQENPKEPIEPAEPTDPK
jgi:hypothetical protein